MSDQPEHRDVHAGSPEPDGAEAAGRRGPGRPSLRAVGAGVVAAATVAVLAFQPAASLADPSGRPVSELLADLQVLYSKSEAATAAYRKTAGRLERQRTRTEDAERALSSVRTALAANRREAGRLARQQYRRGDVGLPPVMQLLLADEPRGVLDGMHVVTRAAARQAFVVQRLVAGEHRQRELTAKARSALAKQERLAKRKKEQRAKVRRRMGDVQRMLASLSEAELARLRSLDQPQQGFAGRAGAGPAGGYATAVAASAVSSKAAGSARSKPSSSGARAVKFALRQLGKPYRFGATGPGAYDCSGLTSKAWQEAGRKVPRTSQGQWQQLRRVSLKKLRPGDLVVYYRNAGHVAMYVGKGRVVHAPRPGKDVKLDRMRSMRPVLGAVRPDAGAPSLTRYTLPKLLQAL